MIDNIKEIRFRFCLDFLAVISKIIGLPLATSFDFKVFTLFKILIDRIFFHNSAFQFQFNSI